VNKRSERRAEYSRASDSRENYINPKKWIAGRDPCDLRVLAGASRRRATEVSRRPLLREGGRSHASYLGIKATSPDRQGTSHLHLRFHYCSVTSSSLRRPFPLPPRRAASRRSSSYSLRSLPPSPRPASPTPPFLSRRRSVVLRLLFVVLILRCAARRRPDERDNSSSIRLSAPLFGPPSDYALFALICPSRGVSGVLSAKPRGRGSGERGEGKASVRRSFNQERSGRERRVSARCGGGGGGFVGHEARATR